MRAAGATLSRTIVHSGVRIMRKLKPSAIAAESVVDQPLRRKSLALAVAAAFSAPLPLYAQNLPTGLTPTSGMFTVATPTATSMNINQSTQNASGTAQSFSIGFGNRVDIAQPSASSILMVSVVGNNPSSIFGTLTANGQFWLVNTAGVLFGPTASVDVGGLVASTLPISYSDATSGRYVFTNNGSAGSIVNQGRITALNGYVGLFAPQVANEGIISARMGSVALAAGNQVTLDMVGDGLIKVSVDQAALNASAMNKGTIQADGGNVLLTARSANALLDTVINTDGVIRANSIANRNGIITLDGGNAGIVSVSGTLEAKGTDAGTTGGTVKVLGQYVGLFDGTRINVSGDAGGGTVLVGGDFQGNNPDIQNAFRTYVGPDVTINADAVTNGNGGRVIVWADDTTRFYGNITARGGAQAGDGGFVEVSGKQYLTFKGKVDTLAPHGKTGMLLLDPANIVIANGSGDGAADGTGTFSGSPSNVAGTVLGPDTGPTTIFESELEGIAATTSISLAATNSITVSSLTTDGNLNLAQTAGNSVSFIAGAGGFTMANTANTITTAGGALNITTSSSGGATLGNLATAGGLVTINVDGASSASGIISGANTALTKAGAGTLTLSGANTYTGSTTVNAGTLSLTGGAAIANTGAVVLADVAGVVLNVAASETIGSLAGGGASGGNVTLGASTLLTTGDATNTTFAGVMSGTGALAKQGAGIFTLSGANTYTGATDVNAGTLVAANATALGTTAGSTTVANNATLSISGVAIGAEAITLTGTGDGSGALQSTGAASLAGNITLAGSSTIGVLGTALTLSGTIRGAAADTQTLTINSGTSTLNLNGIIGGANQPLGVTVTATGGTVNVNAAINAGGSGVTIDVGTGGLAIGTNGDITSGGAVSLTGAGGISTAGDITTSDDNVTFNSATSLVTNAVVINTGTGAGDITFSSTLNGAQNLTLTAGTGSVSFAGLVGNTTPLGAITITSADDVTTNGVRAASFVQTDGSGTTTLNAGTFTDLTVEALKTTAAAGVNIVNGTIVVNAGITTTGGGIVTLNADIATLTIIGAGDIVADSTVSLTGATGISTAGNVTTTSDTVTYVSATTLTGAVAINTTIGGGTGGTVTFSSTLDGNQTLVITAGATGNVVFTGIVGATAPLGAVSIVSATDVTATTFSATSLAQTAGAGTTTLGGAVTTTGLAGVSIAANAIALNNTITTTAGDGTVTLNAGAGGLTIAALGDISSGGVVSLTGGGAGISTAGDVTTTNDNVTFNSATSLVTNTVAIDTGTGAGDITFSSTLNGPQDLRLTAGTGSVVFTGVVGNTTDLGGVSIVSALNVTATTFEAVSLAQTAGTGTTTLNGAVTTTGLAGVSIAANAIALNNTITTTAGDGTVTLNAGAGGLAIGTNGDITSGGAVSLTGAGGISTAGDITTSADNVTFNSATLLQTNAVVINTGAGAGDITFSSTRSGDDAAIISSAAEPSVATSACMPCCTSIRARKPAMSGSSSTTRTRNAACACCAARPEARSLIDDFYAREIIGVLRDARFDARKIRGSGAVLELLAEHRYQFEAVGIAHALHAVAELAQLPHVACAECRAQCFEFLLAIGHERRDQILEVLGNGYGNCLFVHRTIIRCRRIRRFHRFCESR